MNSTNEPNIATKASGSSENAPSDRQIAAIDLGSNSFHMVVAKVIGSDLQIVSRHKQRVRLADGLDSYMNLDNAAIQRGLDCLAMFAERLVDFAPQNSELRPLILYVKLIIHIFFYLELSMFYRFQLK